MHTGVQPLGIDPNQIDASCKRLQELIDLNCPPTPVTIVGDEVEDWGLSCAAEAYGCAQRCLSGALALLSNPSLGSRVVGLRSHGSRSKIAMMQSRMCCR